VSWNGGTAGAAKRKKNYPMEVPGVDAASAANPSDGQKTLVILVTCGVNT